MARSPGVEVNRPLVHKAHYDTTAEQRMTDPDHVPVMCGATNPGQYWAVSSYDVTCPNCDPLPDLEDEYDDDADLE